MQVEQTPNCKIVKMSEMTFIGFSRQFVEGTAHADIPRFWDEYCAQYVGESPSPATACHKAVAAYSVGEYAVCVDDPDSPRFRYLIAGRYTGGEVPAGMELYEFPSAEWAVFDCVGPIPQSLQSLTTRVFTEWLPASPLFALDGHASVEWYDCTADPSASDYRSALWLPIKHK